MSQRSGLRLRCPLLLCSGLRDLPLLLHSRLRLRLLLLLFLLFEDLEVVKPLSRDSDEFVLPELTVQLWREREGRLNGIPINITLYQVILACFDICNTQKQ